MMLSTLTLHCKVPLHGVCLRGRLTVRQLGLDYAITLQKCRDSDGDAVCKMGFANDRTVDPRTYFDTDVDASKDLSFLSVKDHAPLWQR
jgi:hypothetical protein